MAGYKILLSAVFFFPRVQLSGAFPLESDGAIVDMYAQDPAFDDTSKEGTLTINRNFTGEPNFHRRVAATAATVKDLSFDCGEDCIDPRFLKRSTASMEDEPTDKTPALRTTNTALGLAKTESVSTSKPEPFQSQAKQARSELEDRPSKLDRRVNRFEKGLPTTMDSKEEILARVKQIDEDLTTEPLFQDGGTGQFLVRSREFPLTENGQWKTITAGNTIIISINKDHLYTSYHFEHPEFAPLDSQPCTFDTDVKGFLAGTFPDDSKGPSLLAIDGAGYRMAGATTWIITVGRTPTDDRPINNAQYSRKIDTLRKMISGATKGKAMARVYRRPEKFGPVTITVEWSHRARYLRVLLVDERTGVSGGTKVIEEYVPP